MKLCRYLIDNNANVDNEWIEGYLNYQQSCLWFVKGTGAPCEVANPMCS